jgi:short-subunit dehydrogenase
MKQCSAVIVGVGPVQGLGASLARYFAGKGLHVFIAGRSEAKLQQVAATIQGEGGAATCVVVDATVEQDIAELFSQVKQGGFTVDIAAYNVDSNISAPLLETSTETFTQLWQQNCLGAFFFGKEVVRAMQENGRGTLFFTGATASMRAKPPFTAFASAKAGLRALAGHVQRVFTPGYSCRARRD